MLDRSTTFDFVRGVNILLLLNFIFVLLSTKVSFATIILNYHVKIEKTWFLHKFLQDMLKLIINVFRDTCSLIEQIYKIVKYFPPVLATNNYKINFLRINFNEQIFSQK